MSRAEAPAPRPGLPPMRERTVSLSPEDLPFFIWALAGYDNLCTAEIVRKQKGKVSLRYPANVESEVFQVVESLFREMNPGEAPEQEARS